jgi:teichoic acid transport system permease protein
MMNPLPPGLQRLGVVTPLGSYLREIWDRREFAVVVPANDIRAQNMDTVLGQVWHILNPAVMIAVYWVVFGVILKTNRGIDNYLGFLVIGVLLFQLTQRVVQECSAAVPRNEGLIRSIQFPRALLPLSSLVGQTIAFVPALAVLVLTLIVTGEVPSFRWLALLPIFAAQALFNMGAGFIAARLGARLLDLQQILPHLFRLLFYISGVLFSVDRMISNEAIVRLIAINPMYSIITAARWAVLGTPCSPEVGFSLAGWALLLPVVGVLYFRANEHRYGA